MDILSNRAFTDGPTLNNGATMPWLGLGVYKVSREMKWRMPWPQP